MKGSDGEDMLAPSDTSEGLFIALCLTTYLTGFGLYTAVCVFMCSCACVCVCVCVCVYAHARSLV